MRNLVILFLLFIPLLTQSQNRPVHSFLQLSTAEKIWTMGHPFIAMKAWNITVRTQLVTDSLQKEGIPDRDPSGGKLDAFRHSFWMATLTEKIGVRKALSLGRAHEKGNYRDFKRKRFEEGDIPDKATSDMDLFNNKIGAGIGSVLKGGDEKRVVDSVLRAIAVGRMVIVLKDSLGRSCDSLLIPIPKPLLQGKWITPRLLVPSDRKLNAVVK
jgi:hypothetical protein